MRSAFLPYLFFISALFATVTVADDIYPIPSNLTQVELYPVLRIALDEQGEWSLRDAMRARFNPPIQQRWGFLQKQQVLWIKIVISNPHDERRAVVLDIGDFAPDHVTQFVVDRQSGEILSHEEAGSAYPVSERFIKSHNIAFPLTLAPNALVDVYLRVQSKTRIQLAPRLYSSLAFQQQEHAFYTGAYLCYGGLIALVLYHLIFSLYSRESESAYFIFFMVTWGAYSALLEGLLQPLIPDQLIIYFRSDYQAAAAIFPVIALAAFTAKYLRQLKTYAYFRWILAGVCIITAITSTVTIAGWFPFPQMRNIIILMVVAAICIHTLIFSVLVINGHGPARFYLAGALLMLFFILNVAWIYIAYTGLYTDVGIWLRLSYMSPLLFFAAGYGQRINELRTQHNESLKSAALAKEKMEFKTRFFAKMTHEIRSPMNGIIGPVELLRLTTLTKEQEKYIDIIETSGNALLHISNDILDFSKLEAGKLALSVSTFSLRDLVAECASIFSVHPKRNAILFDTDIAADLPDYFEGDEYRLRQVLFNLIGNAFKFTDKGSIKLNVRRVDDALTNDIIEFSVIDSGIGIDADDLTRLFSEYQQVGAARAGEAGTGLGLAICKQLIELMGGAIAVCSQPGIGSNFYFRIPLRAAALA